VPEEIVLENWASDEEITFACWSLTVEDVL
jgi:hypothetical protein